MKKLFITIVSIILCLTFVGCKEEEVTTSSSKRELTGDELFWDKDADGTPDWQQEEITLTYATWQYNNPDSETIDTMLIKEFMRMYPNITVEMQIVGEDAVWEENMLALLETESIPDVFLVKRLENMLPYGVLADLTEYYNHDSDTQYIFDSIKDLGLYKNKRYVIPTYIYPQVWVVNLDLLDKVNVPAPGYDWTWAQMENIAKAVTDTTKHYIGSYGTDHYRYEYTKVLKVAQNQEVGSKWMAFGYDGTKFNFDDDVFLTAMDAMTTGLNEGWLVNELSEEDIYTFYGDATIDQIGRAHV